MALLHSPSPLPPALKSDLTRVRCHGQEEQSHSGTTIAWTQLHTVWPVHGFSPSSGAVRFGLPALPLPSSTLWTGSCPGGLGVGHLWGQGRSLESALSLSRSVSPSLRSLLSLRSACWLLRPQVGTEHASSCGPRWDLLAAQSMAPGHCQPWNLQRLPQEHTLSASFLARSQIPTFRLDLSVVCACVCSSVFPTTLLLV